MIAPGIDLVEVLRAVTRSANAAIHSVQLHCPELRGNELAYLEECVDTAWVSYAGSFVTRFDRELAQLTGARHAVVMVNGTAALHVALMLAGVGRGEEVLMPSLTFVATANAVAYLGAVPHFCEVEARTLGLDPARLARHLDEVAERRGEGLFNRATGRRIAAIVPMHTFGHPVDMEPLMVLADRWGLVVVEDAAESLGSYYHGRHTGTFGRMGILSFNGNKIVTTGGGGAIITDDDELAARARHLTTTAKAPHRWEFIHDEVGFNYRMPNINAAVGCAQLEQLPGFLERKRRLAQRYVEAFEGVEGISVFREPPGCRSNYWLNVLLLDEPSLDVRDALLAALNDAGLQSRPIWKPMHQLRMYADCPRMDLTVTEELALRVINVPSSAGLVPAEGAGTEA